MITIRNRNAVRAHPLACALLVALGTGVSIAPAQSLPDISARASGSKYDQLRTQHFTDMRARRARIQARELATDAHRPATTLAVTNCGDNPDDPGSLRGVIGSAVSGDVIDLSALTCSTITLSRGQIPIRLESLTLHGPGQDQLTIDAGEVDRHFYHYGTGKLTIKGVTIANGRRDEPDYAGFRDGGCILSLGNIVLDHVTVTACEVSARYTLGGAMFAYGIDMASSTISNSRAEGYSAEGGGVFVRGDGGLDYGLTMQSSAITGNTAAGHGSGAFGGGASLLLTRVRAESSTISDNIDARTGPCINALYSLGGGINMQTFAAGYYEMRGTVVSLIDSAIVGNSTKTNCGLAAGGGLYLLGSGSLDITSSTISGNVVAGQMGGIGGGIIAGAPQHDHPIHHIRNSTISGNVISGELAQVHDSAYGAGVLVGGSLWLDQSTVTGNRVETGQSVSAIGGVSSRDGFQIVNSTIAFNSALQSSGGLRVQRHDSYYETTSTIVNSIIAGNVAPTSADLGIGGNVALGAVMVDGNNNLIGLSPDDPDIVLPADTLYGDPHLLPLAWNGGLTQTHALGPGSPAVDAGASPDETYDQRGFPFVRTVGGGADIGAVEQQTPRLAVALAFVPERVGGGESSTLVLTLIDTYPLAATLTSPLVNTLPAGLIVASPANAVTTCTHGSFAAGEGTSTITLNADTQIPVGSCTFSVDVTSASAGIYVNTLSPGALSTTLGINAESANATLIVSSSDAIFVDGFDGS